MWEGMVGRHSVINWEEGHFELIGPGPSVILGCMAWEADKASSMHMDYNILKLNYMLYPFAFFHHRQLFVIKYSNQNAFFIWFEDVQILTEVTFWRNVYL